MNARRSLAITIALPLLAACTTAAQYSESEALNKLSIDRTASSFDVRFAPGSDRLLPADAARLRRLAAAGAIAPEDRINIATSGEASLGDARSAAVSSELLRYGIVVTGRLAAAAPPDRAVVAVSRTLVRLPDCPNWSKPSGTTDFTNSVASNFGCATVTNLGRMVAHPTDLARGEPLGLAQGGPAIAAVGRYQADKVPLPPPESRDVSTSTAAATPPIASLSGAPGAVGGGSTADADVNANR
jgi:type IV pilus biogenesis protein CpaD/CtpE